MVTDAVITYLDELETPDRLFLFAHYFDPHELYAAPARFTERYDSESEASLWSVADVRGTWFTNWFRQGAKQHHARRHALRYAAEVSYLDSEVGRLLGTLRDRGILDESLLVIASDHGETFLEHDEEFDHGHEVYQTTIRAVGMVRQPNGDLGGTAIRTPASTIDIFPTILNAVQITPPAEIDGIALDLSGTLGATGETDGDRVLFGQATKPWEEVETDPRWYNIRKARMFARVASNSSRRRMPGPRNSTTSRLIRANRSTCWLTLLKLLHRQRRRSRCGASSRRGQPQPHR